jgi:hypothetical protein
MRDEAMKKIPPFRLVPTPLTDEARQLAGFKWAADEVGTRHQLGGEPFRAIKEERWPRCPDCKETMTFYGQLDSLNDEFCIADVGLIYVFICLDCNEVKAEIHTT